MHQAFLRRGRSALSLLWALCALLAFLPAGAHQAGDSYLVIDASGAETLAVRWDIALRDLDAALAIDHAGDGGRAWDAVPGRVEAVDRYALARLALQVDGHPCALQSWRHGLDQHSDGPYLVGEFRTDCPADGRTLEVAYRLFFDRDPLHRGLLRLRTAAGTRSAVLGPDAPPRRFSLGGPSPAKTFGEYFRHGVWHIWQGIDHILFLLSLLLPSVLMRTRQGWQGARRLRDCLLDILRVVTAFTLAHSITLSLAALGWVQLPSRLVESTIAASVLLAALNNVWPVVGEGRWKVAFGFGLIHGFGFASVLADLGLSGSALAAALLGFNLGVESGQLVIVLAFIPLAWPGRGSRVYRTLVLRIGSALVGLLAAIWLIERVADLRILPFTV